MMAKGFCVQPNICCEDSSVDRSFYLFSYLWSRLKVSIQQSSGCRVFDPLVKPYLFQSLLY